MNMNLNTTGNLSLAISNAQIPDDFNIEDADIFELFDSDMLDYLPGIREIRILYKGYISIRDRLFFKNFIIFLKEYNSKTISEKKLTEFKRDFDQDEKHKRKVMENLIFYIDQTNNIQKIKILAKLFRAYVEGNYNWSHFVDMADALNKVNLTFLKDIPKLKLRLTGDKHGYNETAVLSESNLITSGLAVKVSGFASQTYPSNIGLDIYKYGLS